VKIGMDEYFSKVFQKEIIPVLEGINATKVSKIHGWINPDYLYYLDDSLWFSCSYDWKDHLLEVDLGRLFLFRDCLPRVIVLEDYSSYLNELCDRGHIKKKELRKRNRLPDGVTLVAKTLLGVLSDHEQLTHAIKEKIKEREDRISQYLIREIVNPEMLFSIINENDETSN